MKKQATMIAILKANHLIFHIGNMLNTKSTHLIKQFLKYTAINPSILRQTIYLSGIPDFEKIIPKSGRAKIQFETRRHWQPMIWK